ncbi:MAG TPA: FG-GAP-like repeat-containing protein [Ignavibacteria bacterium]|nr:FG-GAP-like repeat-containing protein [Ignavibacteria bacterium]
MKSILNSIIAIIFFICIGISSESLFAAQIQNDVKLNEQTQKNDSLPAGVTQDWLSSLTDENGNKFIQENSNSKSSEEESEGDAFQRKIFNGLSPGAGFGTSVSSAGDVNGDGYDDIIVSAFVYSSATGRAYIYYGGINMNTTPDVILTGEAINNYFGISVSSAGDVNGDGYSDVFAGAYGYNSNTGRAYIYFGSSNMDNTADVILTGGAASDLFGVSVSSAGDLNGDGYSDVIAGASGYISGTGRAYIYFGGSSMNNVADVTMTGAAASNFFGYSVSSAGDVNGDGFADVISGAYGYNSSTGRAYIYLGGTLMNNIADVTLTGEAVNNDLGYSVSSAGDVNGDGYADVIAGAFGYSAATGRAYIYYGSSNMNNAADVTITGEPGGSSFGASVSSAGDINGDGYADVISGAYAYNTFTGKVYVYFGGSSMNNVVDAALTGEGTGNSFGRSVSSAGDINADGYDDILIGANGFNANTGRVNLYDYFMKGNLTEEFTMTGESTGNSYGTVSSAGDVNGDGFDDMIVGASNYSSNTGRAYIYFGGVFMDNAADVILTGGAVNNYFGGSVSSAGDVNGDGYDDVIAGASAYSTNTGRAYIYFGGSSMDNTPDVTMTGGAVNNYFGCSVSSAGDANGDGYSDVIVGANGYNTNTGRAYIFYGGSSMNNTADITMTGETINNSFGSSVSFAGDMNGDGYSDVIVGAFRYTSNTGRAYVFFGSSSVNNQPDLTFTGENVGDYFGVSVSSADDVNGDGYSDIIVGAPVYNSSAGKVYIYYGGIMINNFADVIMVGEASTSLGGSVSSAGDVNGDGYSDVIAGAYTYNSNTGKACIYLGGSNMNSLTDAVMVGEGGIDQFGESVSSAGDLNRDGYSDFIVGSYYNNINTGKAYLYYGSAISIKPILMHVRDVPNDQGGFIDLKWARSSYDVISTNIITDYLIQRSAPPVSGNYAWVNIDYIPATKELFYSYIAGTPFDSSSLSNGAFFFRITARTSDPNQFWRSAILSGRSVDNIAPLMLSIFTAAPVLNNVVLNWKRSNSSDLLNYIIYRSTSPNIDPETEPVIATTSDSTYLDTSPLSGLYYYFIVAQDIHNNKSPVAVAESPNMALNLTMFIEGFYNAGSNSQVSDSVTVELRNATSPFAVADISKVIAASDGTAIFKFGTASNGNYFIAVKHRNSIQTWSNTTIALSVTTSANFNFTSSVSQAFGNNMIQIDASPLRFAIYSGDVNQDGIIDASDLSSVENAASVSLSGYVLTDLTGDDFVDAEDLSIVENNASNSVSVAQP